MENLREIVDVMERRADGPPCETAGWTRDELIHYIEALRPTPPARRPRVVRIRRPRMARNLGVGRYCQALLAKVVGRDDEGHEWGLSYEKMVKMAQRKFPDSAVDERHLRWYAAKMRREGMTPPVYRERSRW